MKNTTKVLWLLPTLLFASAAVGAERFNVVWIVADDLSPDLGCYGYEGVRTPHLDRLAAQGTRYTKAFATAPVCSSSRSAFVTGVYQTTTGTHHHRTSYKQPLPGKVKTVSELMRDAGYYVCNTDASMKKAGKTDYNFSLESDLYQDPNWANRDADQPFFAQVQIHEPHRKFRSADDDRRDQVFEIPAYYPEHPVVRADWANYLASVEEMDRKVGQVLAKLRRTNESDRTVVFFFGDHGRPHYRDKQWLYDGGIRVPLIVHWPGRLDGGQVREEMVSLIDIAAATLGVANVETPQWMQGKNFLDRGFAGRDAVFAARDRCGSTVDRIRCVRTTRYKYIRNDFPDRPYWQHSGYKQLQYPGMTVARVLHEQGRLRGAPAAFWEPQRPSEELYDLDSDPQELTNLALDPTHAQKLASLRERLDRWGRETGDRGREPEPGLEATIESSENWYRKAMRNRGFDPHPDPEQYLKWWQEQLRVKDSGATSAAESDGSSRD